MNELHFTFFFSTQGRMEFNTACSFCQVFHIILSYTAAWHDDNAVISRFIQCFDQFNAIRSYRFLTGSEYAFAPDIDQLFQGFKRITTAVKSTMESYS